MVGRPKALPLHGALISRKATLWLAAPRTGSVSQSVSEGSGGAPLRPVSTSAAPPPKAADGSTTASVLKLYSNRGAPAGWPERPSEGVLYWRAETEPSPVSGRGKPRRLRDASNRDDGP